MSSPHDNKEKSSYQCVASNNSFSKYSHTFARLQFLRFLFFLLGHLKTLMRSAPIENKHLTKALFHQPTLLHNFLYSLTICLLHYYPRHVSSINMPIFRRKNCIHTASGIFALCKRLHITLVESGLLMNKENCALKLVDEIILYYDARSKKHQNDKSKLARHLSGNNIAHLQEL